MKALLVALSTVVCSIASADSKPTTYIFKATDGAFETSGSGCSSGVVMKEVTRAVADSVDKDGLTIDISEKTLEVVKKLPGDGEKRIRAPKLAFTSGGVLAIWASAAKTGPGDVLTSITVGDVVPCDPWTSPHGCPASVIKLSRLGAKVGVAIGAEVSLTYGGCTATWVNSHGLIGKL